MCCSAEMASISKDEIEAMEAHAISALNEKGPTAIAYMYF